MLPQSFYKFIILYRFYNISICIETMGKKFISKGNQAFDGVDVCSGIFAFLWTTNKWSEMKK